MQIRILSTGDVLRLAAAGTIAHDGSADDDPLGALGGPEMYARPVLLSLEETDYIDSMGLGWLLKWHKRFQAAGGMLVIHSVPPAVVHVLKLMQMDRVLNLAEDEQAAAAEAEGSRQKADFDLGS